MPSLRGLVLFGVVAAAFGASTLGPLTPAALAQVPQDFECPICGSPVGPYDPRCARCGTEFEPIEEPPPRDGDPDGDPDGIGGYDDEPAGGGRRSEGGPLRYDLRLGVEPAYVEPRGQFALALEYDYFQGNYLNGLASKQLFNFEHVFYLGLQMGLLDGVQLNLGQPFNRHVTNVKGAANKIISPAGEVMDLGGAEEDLDDFRLGLRVRLLEQDRDNPEVAAGFDVSAPTGDYVEFIGRDVASYTPALMVSKEFGKFIWNASTRYRFTPGSQNRLLARDVDRKELEWGMGMDFPISRLAFVSTELSGRTEDFGTKRTGIITKFGDFANSLVFFTPGLKTYRESGFKFAWGVPLGVSEDAPKLGWLGHAEISF